MSPRYALIISQFPETHETFVLREVLELRRRGHDVTIFSLKPCRDAIIHPEARPLMEETFYGAFFWSWRVWKAQAYWLFCHPLWWLSTFFYMAETHRKAPEQFLKLLIAWPKILYFARIMQKRRLTHLHAHWATVPASAAMVIAKLLDISWSVTAHAWDIFVTNPTLVEKLRTAKFVLTCTDYNRKQLVSLLPEASPRILRAYHGVDVDRFKQPPAPSPQPRAVGDLPLILSVGRLTETKGFPYLLQACRQLKEKGRRFRCVIVGEGPDRQALEGQIKSLGIENYVRLAGALTRSDVQALYREAQLFVLPSIVARNGDRDGIPNVVLEVMAAGLPVVSTEISGIPEAIQHGKTGCLVPERDADALAHATEELLQNPERCRQLGAAGQAYVSAAFGNAQHMDALDAILRKALLRPQRVLYLIWSLEIGGAERVVSLLAQHINRSHYEPMVDCLNSPGQLAAGLKAKGIPVIPLYKRGPVDFAFLLRLIRVIRKERIDLIHTHLWGANLWGRVAAWWTKTPVVCTEHSTDAWKPGYYFWIDRYLARHTQKLIAVSEAVRNFYISRGISPALCQVIPNGIDTTQFPAAKRSSYYDELKWEDSAPVFAVAGRLVEAKNFDLFIDAMAELIAKRPQARGLIIGEGSLRASIEQRIQAKGLQGRVVLAGARNDMAAIFHGARAVVFTSTREGMPMVLIEAMAAGLPVVSTRVGGIPEVLSDGSTGYLVDSGDKAALVERLCKLTDDPALARQMGAAAQADARTRFSIEVMTSRHEALYEEVLAPPVRVMHIIDHLDAGGAQSQLLEVARHLSKKRWAVSVISLSTSRIQLVEQFRASGVDVILINQSGKWSWPCFWVLKRCLSQLKPQIVQTWLFTADLYGRLAARLAGVPVVIAAVRSVEPAKKQHYILVDRWLQEITDAVTVNAEAIRLVLREREQIREQKIRTIYNGVDLAVFSPAAVNGQARHGLQLEASPVVGMVSRFMPEKDPLTFVQAAGLIAAAVPEARFLIVGDGPLRNTLEVEAARLGISQRCVFTGFRADRAGLIQAMDVLVLSSLYEGCANVILEAMALAKPVVATHVGGNPELVEEDRTGFLVPVRDPQAMAKAVVVLLRDLPRARGMGQAGQRRIENDFSIEQMIGRTEALYQQLLNSKT